MTTPLLPLLPSVYDVLFSFAQSDGFWANLETAFGTSYDVVKATQLRQQWQSRNFSQIPPIEVLSDEVLGTANGAYSSSKNKIYLSASFLNTASSAAIVNVILEEIGHYVDAQINQVDSAGDEGAIFAELVQGNSLDVATLEVLKAEDDSKIINLEGEAITVEQNGLIDPSNFTLNNSAQFWNSSVLRLTNDYWQSGSAFLTNTIALSNNTSFNSYFQFQITNSDGLGDDDGAGADGLVFIIQTIANNAGSVGGGIGYEGINKSLGIEFDTYYNSSLGDINGNHVGVDLNGDINSVIAQPVTNRLNNGNIWNAWVDYNGSTDVLEVRVSETNQRPTTPLLSYTVDLLSILGQSNAFIGFSSGTGAGTGIHDILDWEFNNTSSPIITLAVSPASVTEDSTPNLVYTFTRTTPTTSALTVNYTVGGTATFSTDYTQSGAASFTSTTGTVTFAVGSATATVTVDPTADTIVESDETVILTLASGTGYTVGTTTPVTGTITNDDTSVTLAVSPASVTEDGTTNLVYTFTRSGVTTNPLTVNYTIGGTATLNTDYTRTGTNNTVTFAAGSSTATVTIDPTADTIVESNETVILTLAAGTGYTVGTTTPVTGTINNDDTSVTLAVSPASVTEDGTTNLVYTFTRSGVTTNPLTVNYTIGGTATLNTDYTRTGTNNTVTFAAGSSTATVTIDPTADTIVESNETVILTLATGTGYTIGTTTPVTGTITNDDTSVTLAVSPASVTEDGTTNLVYTFTRSGVTTNPLTVNYTIGGTATLNTDYTRTGTNNTVTFAAGSSTATVTIDPTADTIVESNETVILTLAAGTGYTIGTPNAATGTINNDDTSVTSQLSINDITVVEGKDNNAILTVTVDNPNPQPITFNYTTAPINATANVDYTSKTGTITIAPNTATATISIPILNDNLNEPDEAFTVTLSNPVNATINPEGGIGEVIITDTWQSTLTRTLPNNVENLRLIGTNNINGTGNAGNNNITGNNGINQINGGVGIDTLTGGLGADIFIFQFGQSTISTSDRITDFAINTDKIDLLTQGGLATNAPISFSRAANSTVTTLQNLINQVFTDANGAITGNQGLGVNSAALVQVTTGAIAGTYLVINDSTAGFQSSNDLLINITGFTGTLPALGNIPVGNFFI